MSMYEELYKEANEMIERVCWHRARSVLRDLTNALHETTLQRDGLLSAIRRHRDYRGDDRCWEDDAELYAVLPDGDTRPERDTAVTIENCQRFIACRQQGREYVSPQREIERLTVAYTEAAAALAALQKERDMKSGKQ